MKDLRGNSVFVVNVYNQAGTLIDAEMFGTSERAEAWKKTQERRGHTAMVDIRIVR